MCETGRQAPRIPVKDDDDAAPDSGAIRDAALRTRRKFRDKSDSRELLRKALEKQAHIARQNASARGHVLDRSLKPRRNSRRSSKAPLRLMALAETASANLSLGDASAIGTYSSDNASHRLNASAPIGRDDSDLRMLPLLGEDSRSGLKAEASSSFNEAEGRERSEEGHSPPSPELGTPFANHFEFAQTLHFDRKSVQMAEHPTHSSPSL